jgi:hypothetical protein
VRPVKRKGRKEERKEGRKKGREFFVKEVKKVSHILEESFAIHIFYKRFVPRTYGGNLIT